MIFPTTATAQGLNFVGGKETRTKEDEDASSSSSSSSDDDEDDECDDLEWDLGFLEERKDKTSLHAIFPLESRRETRLVGPFGKT